jgi:pimeloyl-ACP methyl ester carboxylesterase
MNKSLRNFALMGFAFITLSQPAMADLQGNVTLINEHKIYVDYRSPDTGKPTVVLLNGLTWDTKNWDTFVTNLAPDGLGILRFDMMGQGRTLLNHAPAADSIRWEDQVEDLYLLLEKLHIYHPVSLLGLSYGGGIALAFAATHPSKVERLILMAPYTSPVPDQDQWVKEQVAYTRLMNPYNPYTDDELYDYYLKILVYSTFPLAEPSLLENPWKLGAVYQMTRGIRTFNTANVGSLLSETSMHLLVGDQDQYLDMSYFDEFWDDPALESKETRVNIEACGHKIPEIIPEFAAAWVRMIMNADPRLSGGRTCNASPASRQALCGSEVISVQGL